ncbi:MAG: PIN/TRAM domain-containing protein [Planctomycetes bacterium HGW-Planctomycetes-1]|nr:MAG: PIN/TRAM domain-containing protein [Planctomycetes bacterium HGW-Planctomycetes-1]
MLLHFIRGIFIIVIFAALFVSITSEIENPTDAEKLTQAQIWLAFIGGLSLAVIVLFIDWLLPKKSLSALAGIFFGLIVGIFFSWALSLVLDMVNDVFKMGLVGNNLKLAKWIMGICICYFVISFVMRTKDDVRFIIPYVEFSRQTKGIRPLVLDTSVIIDGRIADICQTKLFDAPLVLPRFVLNELQLIADSADKLKRVRGRRGLDILHKLQDNPVIEVQLDDTPPPGINDHSPVDQKLVAFTKNCNGKLLTNDYNLSKVAQVRQVDVININDLTNALKTVVLPGETMQVRIIKPGEESQQGIGYLDDGTMVVVEEGRNKIGEKVLIIVTSALQTSAGRMIFGKYERPVRENGIDNNDNNHRNKK